MHVTGFSGEYVLPMVHVHAEVEGVRCLREVHGEGVARVAHGMDGVDMLHQSVCQRLPDSHGFDDHGGLLAICIDELPFVIALIVHGCLERSTQTVGLSVQVIVISRMDGEIGPLHPFGVKGDAAPLSLGERVPGIVVGPHAIG